LSGRTKIALATVCTPNFIKGTQALFYSFLKHHPTLDIDLVVICDKGFTPFRKTLKRLDIRFHQVSDELTEAIHHFEKESNTQGKHTSARFYSLELFRIGDYQKVLFMDSDMICQKGFPELFDRTGNFYAAPDRVFYNGLVRNSETYKIISPHSGNQQKVISPTFNTGFMLIGRSYLNYPTYQKLVHSLYDYEWRKMMPGLNDQIIINQYFKGQIETLPVHYNYLLKIQDTILRKEGTPAGESKVLHWVGNPKPWNFKKVASRLLRRKKTPPEWLTWLKSYTGYHMNRR